MKTIFSVLAPIASAVLILFPAAAKSHAFYPAPGHGMPNTPIYGGSVRQRPAQWRLVCRRGDCSMRWRGPKTVITTGNQRCVYKPWKGKSVCTTFSYPHYH